MIAKYSVKKPYTVLVGVLLVLVLGVVSITRMVTDLLPNMSFPYVLVITTDLGATPEEVEADVTAPIEASMATTSNIKSLNSISFNSYSMVILEYEQSTNMDSTIIEVQQALDLLEGTWDKDSIGSPLIMQMDPNMIPIMAVAVSYEGKDAIELTHYVNDELGPSVESVEGVASVNTTGIIDNRIRVTLSEEKIKALNERVEKAIKGEFAKGESEIKDGQRQIDDATKAMEAGGDQLSDAMGQVTEKKAEIAQTKAELIQQKETLIAQKESLETIQGALKGIEEAVSALPDGTPDDMKDGIVQSAAAMMPPELIDGLATMGISLDTYENYTLGVGKLASTITEIGTGIAMIDAGLSQIDEGELALTDALSTISGSAAVAAFKMSASSAQLATAAAALQNAQSTLDQAKSQALSQSDLNTVLSLETVQGLLTAQNFSMPAGYVLQDTTQYMIRVGNKADSIEEFESLMLIDLGLKGIEPITLSDVADIEVSQENEESYAVVNGEDGILLSMQKQTGYSTGAVTDRLVDTFDSLEKQEEGLHLDVLMNQGVYIDFIVQSVVKNIIMGAILAILVLFVFLRSMRPTLIIACSIPLSVLVAIVLMYFTGITLNLISMSGLALGIGMLVDNSIVVVENIYRLHQQGESMRDAAVMGTRQVAGAITASTLTTVSVYAPIVFTNGIARQLFVDMALTILFTLVASLAVAMTLVPAMSVGLLGKETEKTGEKFGSFTNRYASVLNWALDHKPVVFIVAILLLVGSVTGSLSKGLNFLDMEFEADQISLSINAPEGKDLTFDELCDISDDVIAKIENIEGIETIGAMGGGGSGLSIMGGSDGISVYIVLSEDRQNSLDEISDEINKRIEKVPADIELSTDSMDYTQMFGSGLSVEIQGRDLDTLQDLAKKVAAILEETEGTTEVNDGLSETQPEFRITVNREKAAKYNYTVAQVFQLVASKIAETTSSSNLLTDVEEYEIYLETQEQADVTLSDIKDLSFTYTDRDGDEEEIYIRDICDFEETDTLSQIQRKGQTRYLTVSADVDEDHNITLLANEVEKKLAKLDMPPGFSAEITGEDETINDAMKQLVLMMILAIVFIYLIMVAQFQSLRAPFIIMFTIPLAFTGGFLALLLTGKELNVIAMLGLIMLSGLIVNNGIVLIDYINQAREQGVAKREAIVESGKVRLRPILMTVLTTVLSMSTIALGIGQGSEMMQPMAITMIGGLIYGTVLTLVIVPCVFDLFHRKEV